MMIILTLVFAILMAGVLYHEKSNPKFLWFFSILWAIAYMVLVLAFSGMKAKISSVTPETEVEPNAYFVYAEKVKEEGKTVTFATVNLKENQTYSWVNEFSTTYPDVPYLLTMDSKGTQTLEDDEILIVWANN